MGLLGFSGNLHDSIILQSTGLWDSILESCIFEIAKEVGNVEIPPLILGDAAFSLRSWLMKPYADAIVSPEQKYCSYRLNRVRSRL